MEDPLEYLCGLKSTVIRLGLGPVSRLLDRLDNPHNTYGTILIGGTNGKGSIAAMVSSILSHGGFQVGLYTSPHLMNVRERIRINGRMISPEDMVETIQRVKEHVREDVTYFEFLTAVSFLHFYEKKVDLAVLEVGMGGRFDATNVVIPLVSVISNVSLDHREYLGNSLKAIAREKGGIIKCGGVCITAVKQRKVIDVLEGICFEKEARLIRLGRDIRVERFGDGMFSYRGVRKDYQGFFCPLKGRHQIENAAVALGVVEFLEDRGFPVDDGDVSLGLMDTRWEGRLEILRNEPAVLVDGAHNPAGAAALSRALTEEFSYRRLILILGFLNDKDYRSMLKRLAPLSDFLIITKPDTERGMSPRAVLSCAKLYRNDAEMAENSHDALKRALSIADKDDLICVTGSLYLVGEIKRIYSSQ